MFPPQDKWPCRWGNTATNNTRRSTWSQILHSGTCSRITLARNSVVVHKTGAIKEYVMWKEAQCCEQLFNSHLHAPCPSQWACRQLQHARDGLWALQVETRSAAYKHHSPSPVRHLTQVWTPNFLLRSSAQHDEKFGKGVLSVAFPEM